MVPQSTLQQTTILEEAERIKDILLGMRAEVESVAKATETELLKSIRHQLGYSDVKPGNQVGLVDARIGTTTPVITPKMLEIVLPVSQASVNTTAVARAAITNIIDHKDRRLLVVVGPCSIHDPKAALEYAGNVKDWRQQYGDKLEIVMRAYMEKPRTELGWKGFVYDPLLDESDDINLGLIATRLLAGRITELGVPIALERLNALTPQYVNSLIAYDVIGARNTLDQKSREYASGTSSPIGFKNTPEGSIEAAIQAIVSASRPHSFLGIRLNGAPSQITSTGNDTAHIVLRGDNNGPNYSAEHIAEVKQLLEKKGLKQSIVVDASHGNSRKEAAKQIKVIEDVCRQISNGEAAIVGVMVESNLVAGAQKLKDPKDLVYGQSITDECIGLDETDRILALLTKALDNRSI